MAQRKIGGNTEWFQELLKEGSAGSLLKAWDWLQYTRLRPEKFPDDYGTSRWQDHREKEIFDLLKIKRFYGLAVMLATRSYKEESREPRVASVDRQLSGAQFQVDDFKVKIDRGEAEDLLTAWNALYIARVVAVDPLWLVVYERMLFDTLVEQEFYDLARFIADQPINPKLRHAMQSSLPD